MDAIVKINGKESDLSKALPLTIGNMKKLKREYSIDLVKQGSDGLNIEDIATLLFFICSKANPDITIEDVDELPTTQLASIMEVFNRLQAAETADKDFLKP